MKEQMKTSEQAAPSDARKLCDMYQQLAEAMGYHSGEGGMEFSPEEWASALLRDATAFRALTQPTTVQLLKDHEIAKLVNDLRDVAKEFHGHQSLRERIAHLVLPIAAREQEADAQTVQKE